MWEVNQSGCPLKRHKEEGTEVNWLWLTLQQMLTEMLTEEWGDFSASYSLFGPVLILP